MLCRVDYGADYRFNRANLFHPEHLVSLAYVRSRNPITQRQHSYLRKTRFAHARLLSSSCPRILSASLESAPRYYHNVTLISVTYCRKCVSSYKFAKHVITVIVAACTHTHYMTTGAAAGEYTPPILRDVFLHLALSREIHLCPFLLRKTCEMSAGR